MRPNNFVGFAPADWALALVTGSFLLSLLVWKPKFQAFFAAVASRPWTCMMLFFAAPITLRLLLLPHHPAPTPDVYDEFSHLLMADTLLHGRLANPPHVMHRFFETFFVLQQPTYSSIYAPGMGLTLAFGRLISDSAWTGILFAGGAFCATCYWMLRGWVSPQWAFLGGVLAVIEFGPLCQWMNSYWGGYLPAIGGCLVFGALPRLKLYSRRRDAILLGLGFGLHMITREFETVLLSLALLLFVKWRVELLRTLMFALVPVVPAVLLILMQNKAVTNSWTQLPERLSQYEYGVPVALTMEPNVTPHVPLTPEQDLDYKAQTLAHGAALDSISRFFLRLEYRVRYIRFFFLPPLYLALLSFLFALRDKSMYPVVGAISLFALGTNLFPYFMAHYVAAVTCLLVLISVIGIEHITKLRVRDVLVGIEIARVTVVLCLAQFGGWYVLHLFESPDLYQLLQYETWDVINHANPQRRISVNDELKGMEGQLLVFVRYSTHHVYQSEWVWNGADIDGSRIVYARDLGTEEDAKLIAYYPRRKVLLLEPDGYAPRLSNYPAVTMAR